MFDAYDRIKKIARFNFIKARVKLIRFRRMSQRQVHLSPAYFLVIMLLLAAPLIAALSHAYSPSARASTQTANSVDEIEYIIEALHTANADMKEELIAKDRKIDQYERTIELLEFQNNVLATTTDANDDRDDNDKKDDDDDDDDDEDDD